MADDVYFDAYPYLSQLLGTWFHQDFDINGDVPAIIPKYAGTVDTATLWATVADIRRFLQWKHADITGAFTTTFQPDIDPAGWGMTTEEWLRWIERLLVQQLLP